MNLLDGFGAEQEGKFLSEQFIQKEYHERLLFLSLLEDMKNHVKQISLRTF